MPAQTDSSHPPRKMTYIYVYWDDSNVFISAKDVTMEKEGEETRPREDSFCQPGESGPQSKVSEQLVQFPHNSGDCG